MSINSNIIKKSTNVLTFITLPCTYDNFSQVIVFERKKKFCFFFAVLFMKTELLKDIVEADEIGKNFVCLDIRMEKSIYIEACLIEIEVHEC